MNVDYINPIVTTTLRVFECVLGAAPEKGALVVLPQTFTSQEFNIVLGVVGSLKGSVILGMSQSTADKLAGAMIGQAVTVFDQLAASAIGELGNMISGNALSELAGIGYLCDLTPPTIIQGAQVTMSTVSIPAVVIPLEMAHGAIFVTVSLQQVK
jgi:chemotaxis protein CheX